MRYRVVRTIYFDEDADYVTDDSNYKLLARIGEIFYRKELNDELREEYCVYDEMWKYIFVNKNGNKWLLSQDGETSFCEVCE